MQTISTTALGAAHLTALTTARELGRRAARSLDEFGDAFRPRETGSTHDAFMYDLGRLWTVVDEQMLPYVRQRDPSSTRMLDAVGKHLSTMHDARSSRLLAVSDKKRLLQQTDDALSTSIDLLRDSHLQQQLAALDVAAGNALIEASAARAKGDASSAAATLARAAHAQLTAGAARMESLGTIASLEGTRRAGYRLVFDVPAGQRAVVVAAAAASHASRLLADATAGIADTTSEFSVRITQARHGADELLASTTERAQWMRSGRVVTEQGFTGYPSGTAARVRRSDKPPWFIAPTPNPVHAISDALGTSHGLLGQLPALPQSRREVRAFAGELRDWGNRAGDGFRDVAKRIEPLIDGSPEDLRPASSMVDAAIERLGTAQTHIDAANSLVLDGA